MLFANLCISGASQLERFEILFSAFVKMQAVLGSVQLQGLQFNYCCSKVKKSSSLSE